MLKYNLHYTTIVVFIRLLVIVFVKVYLNQKLFISILWRFVWRIIILLNSGNSFIILILGWDLLGLTSLLLVLYYNSTHVNNRAFHIMVVNSISDRIFIIIILLYSHNNIKLIIFIVIIIRITKSAIWPIHYWLPIAIDAPTPVRCLLHSRTLVVAGFYLYREIITICRNITLLWLSLIRYLMSLNYMWCCEDIKKFIAYSTIINISIIIMYTRRMYSEISYIHVVRHRLYKSVLFLIAGYLLIFNSGNQDIRIMSIPVTFILVLVLIISNIGVIFMFTISTEHLFKMLAIPIHILIIPILILGRFFIVKIIIKLLETLRHSKSYVLTNKLSYSFYILILPILMCVCGDKYLRKVQPAVYYEARYNNILLILFIFVIPINNMHKYEVNCIAPIRLDQELSTVIVIRHLKKMRWIRYNTLIL